MLAPLAKPWSIMRRKAIGRLSGRGRGTRQRQQPGDEQAAVRLHERPQGAQRTDRGLGRACIGMMTFVVEAMVLASVAHLG